MEAKENWKPHVGDYGIPALFAQALLGVRFTGFAVSRYF